MIRETIDARPMSRYQVLIVVMSVVLFTIEGYDVPRHGFRPPRESQWPGT